MGASNQRLNPDDLDSDDPDGYSSADSIITAEQHIKIRDGVVRVVADYISNLSRTIRKLLNDHLMLALGFRPKSKGQGYELDPFSGNKGIIAEYIDTSSRQEVTRVVSELVKTWLQELHQNTEFQDILKHDFLARYRQELSHRLRGAAQEAAERDVKAIGEALTNLKLELPLVKTELANPESYDGKIGRAMLKRMITVGELVVGQKLDSKPETGEAR